MRRLSRLSLRTFSADRALLLLIIIVALALRLNGLDWDSGHGFHPDERSLYLRAGCMYDLLTESPGFELCLADHPDTQTGLPDLRTLLDPDTSPLNPHWFPLGSVLIYILVLARSVIELFTDISALDLRYVGRGLSALADVGSIFLVYVLGRRIYARMYGPWVGVLAAALTALAVIHVQNSHFYRPETFSALLVLAVFWAMLQVLERRRLRDSLLLGLLVGLAFAPKVSILPLALPLALAYGYRLVDRGYGYLGGLHRDAMQQILLHCLAAFLVSLIAFFLVSPYALLDIYNFLSQQLAQTNMARNAGLWPFTIQYVGTPAFFYQFYQTAVWGLGPVLGVVAWAAIPFTIFLVWQGTFSRRGDLLILLWLAPSILFLETFEVRFQRYYFALILFMILLGSRLLLSLPLFLRIGIRDRRNWMRESLAPLSLRPTAAATFPAGLRRLLQQRPAVQRVLMSLAWAPLVLTLAATFLYSLAFQSVYFNPHPAVAASQWLHQRAPAGSVIISDNHWDEFLPELYRYDVWQFPAYEEDSVAKMAELSQRLADSDYLVFYSHRPYVSVASDPERFPLSGQYYRRLFAGDLGYTLEREFVSYPSLPGVSVADDPFVRTDYQRPAPVEATDSRGLTLNWGYADDNVVGYDHPKVMVFRNQARLPVEEILILLVAGAGAESNNLKLTEDQRVRQQDGGTWSELFDRNGLSNRIPVLAWLLVIELVYLVALPFCFFLFWPLPDRGLILARSFGLLGAAYITWLVVGLGWLEFSTLSILLGILVLAGLSGLVLAADGRQFVGFLRERWKLLLTGEVIFLAAFLAFVAIRAFNPDLWHPYRGGEKPMEMAYFSAVVRSTLLPPYDPWFAGGYLNYYYWGYFLLAIPTRLAGIIPTVAFNLAVPLVFALTVTGAYSLVYNLTEGVKRSPRSRFAGRTEPEAPEPESEPVETGRTGWFQRFRTFPSLIPSPVTAGLTAGLFVAIIGNLDGTVQLAQRAWGGLTGAGGGMPYFDFWRSSRMLPSQENIEPGLLTFWLSGTQDEAAEVAWHITEFPFFSFLFADLHAHVMAIPVTLLVIGLGLTLVLGLGKSGRIWHWAALLATGIAVGSLFAINSWDYPTYLLLLLTLAAAALLLPLRDPGRQLPQSLGFAAALIGVSVLAFFPLLRLETFGAGLEISRWNTPPLNFLGIHGLFLVIIGGFLVWQVRRPFSIAVRGFAYWNRPDMASDSGLWRPVHRKWILIYLGLGLLSIVYFAAAAYFTVAFLLGFLALAGLAWWDRQMSAEEQDWYLLFPLALTVLALGLAVGVDLVKVEDDIGRMNTLFKYYLEVWVLLGLAAACFLWRMWRHYPSGTPLFRTATLVWSGLVALLVCSSLIYTFLGTQARVNDRFNDLPPTLDGLAFMDTAVHFENERGIELKWDRQAIEWLQDNVEGSPVILEAHLEQYRWGSRIANYTGLPTVLGWPWHQIQQRGPYSDEVYDRAWDVRLIYDTGNLNLAKDLLSQYQVRFVIVGDLERTLYSAEGLAKFDIMVQEGDAVLKFDNGHVAIYQIGLAEAG